MTSSDERRMVAARLRKAVKEHLYSSSDLGESIAAEVNCYGYPREKVFTHLADLIDPTCKVVPFDKESMRLPHCSVCMQPILKPWPNFCPNCGARIEGVYA